MSDYKTEYQYDEHSGNSYFDIEHNGLSMCGQAKCHPDDADMMSERTGLTIAEARAHIQILKAKKKYEIQPKIDVLRHLLTNIQSSKNHNPRAYESCRLRSQLAHWEGQLAEINADIADEEKYLKEYIDQKDKLYRKLRARNQ